MEYGNEEEIAKTNFLNDLELRAFVLIIVVKNFRPATLLKSDSNTSLFP